MPSPFPLIDLFAGPGGLSEGFSSVRDGMGAPVFKAGVSIEMDVPAHATLSMRALFRHLRHERCLEPYFDFVRGDTAFQEFLALPRVAQFLPTVAEEARCAELGKDTPSKIDKWIAGAIGQRTDAVLIGGPPCQAYSLAGRSRRTNDLKFEKDKKHFLYKEYLRILNEFEPAIFVMENVKGILSSMHGGDPIFERILEDLSRPKRGLEYEIRSFVCDPNYSEHLPSDFVIRAEQFGVPQARHRVILLGVRSDYTNRSHTLLKKVNAPVTVGSMLGNLPKIRSRLSRQPDSFETWYAAICQTPAVLHTWQGPKHEEIRAAIQEALVTAKEFCNQSTDTLYGPYFIGNEVPANLAEWIRQDAPDAISLHQSRGHMRSDLQRYLFAAAFASVHGVAPKLENFPTELLPAHENATDNDAPFSDRFRVQLADRPSTTVVSHISKDGHYYIHPDASQCRSLSVREAARLQTFPDNYHFMGNRTQQYGQVGNAVPPYLARQLGEVVAEIMNQ